MNGNANTNSNNSNNAVTTITSISYTLSSKHLVKSFTFITPVFAVVYALILFPIHIEGTPSNQLAQGHAEICERGLSESRAR